MLRRNKTTHRCVGLPQVVFTDRDGTLIVDRHYLDNPNGVVLLPGVAQALRRLNTMSIPVALVTNQSGLARRYFSLEQYHVVHTRLVTLLADQGARLDAHVFCPDAHASNRRKPAPGMFFEAAAQLGVQAEGAAFVGDRMRDVQAAALLGGRGLLITGTTPNVTPQESRWMRLVPDFATAVDDIIGRLQ